eukprot:gene4697-6596_t
MIYRYINQILSVKVEKVWKSSNNNLRFIWSDSKSIILSLTDAFSKGGKRVRGSIIEMMAKSMSKDETVKLVESWGFRTETVDKNLILNNTVADSNEKKEKSLANEMKVNEKPLITNTVNTLAASDQTLFHPILGERIADLGYKQLYLTSVKALSFAPVWKKQRILRPERASFIANEKVKNGLQSSICGTISIYMNKDDPNDYGIIDGQHRAGALLCLSQLGHWQSVERNVLVEVFPVSSGVEVEKLFKEINSAEPVRFIDMNIASSSMTNNDNLDQGKTSTDAKEDDESENMNGAELQMAIIDEVTEILRDKYSEMFKPTSRCRIPNINIDVLRDDIFQSNLLTRKSINSTKELIDFLEKTNSELGKQLKKEEKGWTEDNNSGRSQSFKTAFKKANTNNFFLGMEKNWLYS